MNQFSLSPRASMQVSVKGVLLFFFLLFAGNIYSQIFNAEVTRYIASYSVKSGTLYESDSVCIKINNSKGDSYAIVEIPYSEGNPVYDLKAHVEDANGKQIRKLKKDEIRDVPDLISINLYDDVHIKSFELKHNTYPYSVKYSYCRKCKEYFSICRWSPVHNGKIPTLFAKLNISIPADYKVSIYQNKMPSLVKDSNKNTINYTWLASYQHPINRESYSPSLDELIPFAWVVPLKFKYGLPGSQQDWAAFGNWVYNLNKGLDELPVSEVEKVHELTNGISDKKLIIEKLYQYLQDNTRYVSVQVGVGAFKSFSAGFTADKKYGDCKALANYMKALLKVVGIPSYWALIYGDNSENRQDIITTFVSSQFNHVILFVPLEHDTIWLDCTSKTNPCGYLGTFTQNRYALVIDENKSQLIKTPALVPSNCYVFSKSDMKIDTSGNVIVTSLTTCKGSSFDFCTIYTTLMDKERQAEYLERIIPYKDFEVKQLNFAKPSRNSASIQLDYKLVLKNNIVQSGNYMFLQLANPGFPEFENPDKRDFPLRLVYPKNYIDTTIVNIPGKYKPEKPLEEDVENKYGTVKVTYLLRDNKLEICRNILINSGEWGTADYPGFYQFITKLHKEIDTPISFVKDE